MQKSLESLVTDLRESFSVQKKIELLEKFPSVLLQIEQHSQVKKFLEKASLEEQLVIKSVIAIDQGFLLFSSLSNEVFDKRVKNFIDQLLPVEKFYSSIGGIVGYHCRMLQLLSPHRETSSQEVCYYPAQGIDISYETEEIRRAVWEGIFHLEEMAEIYPVGGAADRLKLQDERTGEPLPAARLLFLGRSLLENMILDLQAKEYLHYKIFGKQVTTPIALMTSFEKNNHRHIVAICEENSWFGRPQEMFRFFCQPSVPTVDKKGTWCLQDSLKLLLKPGGHGAIWRLAKEEGIFDWFFEKKRKKALVRQINNPIAGVDNGILAFTGIGCKQDKSFGFASCPRQVKVSEGINVILEKREGEKFEYVLTNIEYCDFKKFGIVDEAVEEGSCYSKFSSNTNILFIDLHAILEAVQKSPIPGILVNLKRVTYHTESGHKKEEEVARLESTMQNIADFFVEKVERPLVGEGLKQLKSYLTYNKRNKTISTVKREFALGASLVETPEGCFLDVLRNAKELLERCQMEVPEVHDSSLFFQKGPSFIFLYHPALGPLYSIIAQKIRGGKIHLGGELQLQIAELDLENLELQGSLRIEAEQIMGHFSPEGILSYSEKVGKCILKNVKIKNRGIDKELPKELPNVYWKNEIVREESCHIILRGNSQFYAEEVTLEGDYFIEVEEGVQLSVTQGKEGLEWKKEKLEGQEGIARSWQYEMQPGFDVKLKK